MVSNYSDKERAVDALCRKEVMSMYNPLNWDRYED